MSTRDHRAVVTACRKMRSSLELGQRPRIGDLARDLQLSESSLYRAFRSELGLSPSAYFDALRHERLRDVLRPERAVTEAMFEAGYQSSANFYELGAGALGMKPSRYRQAGQFEQIRFALAECTLGSVLVAASEAGLCAIDLGDDPEALLDALQKRFVRAELIGADPGFESLVARVLGVVDGNDAGRDLPLDIRGTAFQKKVWQALRNIPRGQTVSYANLAKRLGMLKGARAVAQACAANPLAVLVPCHRVVRRDGKLAGYRWGLARKETLLVREAGAKDE